jgi:hypothetical protein
VNDHAGVRRDRVGRGKRRRLVLRPVRVRVDDSRPGAGANGLTVAIGSSFAYTLEPDGTWIDSTQRISDPTDDLVSILGRPGGVERAGDGAYLSVFSYTGTIEALTRVPEPRGALLVLARASRRGRPYWPFAQTRPMVPAP